MLTGRQVLRAIVLAIAAMLLGVLFTIVWVALYSAVIAPGQELAFYEDYAIRSAPLIAVVTGLPILFCMGWLMARDMDAGEGARAGAMVGIAYTVIDFLLLLSLAGPVGIPWGMLALSYGTKIAAGAAGGWVATRNALENAGGDPI
ncbi:hypothetical protein [Sphingomonas sp. LaA6.9]|uniref:hypothetical protein n=1 Tax=Sphingomonas sp. LaA6.9 TaxID=2919914 RepID=UPI001F4F87A4|nr:hypothetical protein [Sphingomonas sp. LaA6.9]MCJ8157276.1 hypothetical protein [Sphingomonas sp. LaA6.9]